MFEVEVKKDIQVLQALQQSSLEEKLLQIQRQLEFVTSQLKAKEKQSKSGKEKEKDSSDQAQETSPEGIFNRLRSSFSAGPVPGPSASFTGQSSSSSTGPCEFDEDELPPYSDPDPPKKKKIFIRKVDLLLNGAPLDQLGSWI